MAEAMLHPTPKPPGHGLEPRAAYAHNGQVVYHVLRSQTLVTSASFSCSSRESRCRDCLEWPVAVARTRAHACGEQRFSGYREGTGQMPTRERACLLMGIKKARFR
eukprot:6209133-Pleurochrysis_carterae.AAC.1